VKVNDDFSNLSKEIAKATPTGVKMANYNPSNTAAKCPDIDATWAAVATPLPPVANLDACSCMMDTLGCTVNTDKVDEKDFGDLFGVVCGYKSGKYCQGIARNATTGSYGAYGMCNATEQLAFAFNQYALANSNGGCDFSGSATTKVAAKTTSGACSTLLSQAGAAGTGTVTSAPTGASAAKSTGAGSALGVSHFETGFLTMGVYLIGASLSGMAMILL
jgi:hypothetical protein